MSFLLYNYVESAEQQPGNDVFHIQQHQRHDEQTHAGEEEEMDTTFVFEC